MILNSPYHDKRFHTAIYDGSIRDPLSFFLLRAYREFEINTMCMFHVRFSHSCKVFLPIKITVQRNLTKGHGPSWVLSNEEMTSYMYYKIFRRLLLILVLVFS